jgi:FkbM family methyltransferase
VCGGEAVRSIYGIDVTDFSGFSEYIASKEFVDEREYKFLTGCDFPEGPVFDVGANIGVISLILARRFPDRVIHAFEPNPSSVRSLRKNISQNQADNVIVRDVAVGAKQEKVLFDANPRDRGTARKVNEKSRHVRQVACVTLDSYVEEYGIEKVSLLKIDVEGYEKEVIKGARRLLDEKRIGLVYFEICPALARKAGFHPASPAKILKQSGYVLNRITPNGGLENGGISEIPKVELENWVAISPEYRG